MSLTLTKRPLFLLHMFLDVLAPVALYSYAVYMYQETILAARPVLQFLVFTPVAFTTILMIAVYGVYGSYLFPKKTKDGLKMFGATLFSFTLLFLFAQNLLNGLIVFGITEMAVLLLGFSIPMLLYSVNEWVEQKTIANGYTIPGFAFGIPLTALGIAVMFFAIIVLQEIRGLSFVATFPVLAALAAPLSTRYRFIFHAFENAQDMDMSPFMKDIDNDIVDS